MILEETLYVVPNFWKNAVGLLDKLSNGSFASKGFRNIAASPPCELCGNSFRATPPSRLAESARSFSRRNYNILSTKTGKKIRERCHDFARSLFFRVTLVREKECAASGACRSITRLRSRRGGGITTSLRSYLSETLCLCRGVFIPSWRWKTVGCAVINERRVATHVIN